MVHDIAQEAGVAEVRSVQQWFTLYMRDWLAERGAVPIGWDEGVDEGPDSRHDLPGMMWC